MRRTVLPLFVLAAVVLLSGAGHPRGEAGRARGHERRHHGEKGEATPKSPAPTAHHDAVFRDATVARDIQAQQRAEAVPNRHYWHRRGGIRYSHFYDGRAHWYGFYHGPAFYWTRYHGGRWWWFDQPRARWVYWWDGYWRWSGPGAAFVYVDGDYRPYAPVIVAAAPAPPPSAPTEPSAGTGFTSPDGKRMVQVAGTGDWAFLYDKTPGGTKYLKYLAKGVDKVKFAGGTEGTPLRILLEFKDGSFALHDADGKPEDAAPVLGPAAPQPPDDTPTSMPPLPTAAPGALSDPAAPRPAGP